jgi:hypothetical protein
MDLQGSAFLESGATRDIDRWPSGDRRMDQDKLDLNHFDLFSPCITGKIINGIKSLNELTEKADIKLDYVNFEKLCINYL